MAALIIHDISDSLIERLEQTAKEKGLSVEQEVKELLESHYASRDEIISRIRQRWEWTPKTTVDEMTSWRTLGRP